MRGQRFGWLTAIIFVIGLCGVATAAQSDAIGEEIALIVGQSTVVRTPWPVTRVAVTDPKVADVQVLTTRQVLVQGLAVGATDLILWSEEEGTESWQRRVVVRLDLERIRADLDRLFPTASLEVTDSGEVLLIQGLLRSADEAQQLHSYLEKTQIQYVDMTSVAGIQQVQLQVRVAEVSRSAIRALGINFFQTDNSYFFGQRIGGSGGPLVSSIDIGAPGGQAAGDNLNFATLDDIGPSSVITLFAGFPNADLQVFLQALAEDQYLRLLANPTLVALSGERADFLAGGEFPIPVPQTSGGGAGTITIEYKEFGVHLGFEPTVLGDGGIRLHAIQEVSELTDVGGLTIEGFTVPGLITRRAEATLELKSGQSFAMAGLIQNKTSAVSSRIPGLGDLPILGPLFRSVAFQNDQTELVILVTASLVEPMSEGFVPPLPGSTHTDPNDWELYVEGRVQGRKPAPLDPDSAEWLREMGLSDLVGPGAWDTYEGKMVPAAPSEQTPQDEPAGEPKTNGGLTEQPSAATTKGRKTAANDNSQRLPWQQPSELPGI
jgi:pilus assembly protein CpaC